MNIGNALDAVRLRSTVSNEWRDKQMDTQRTSERYMMIEEYQKCIVFFCFSSSLRSSLELSDANVYEPQVRARLEPLHISVK